MYLETNIALKYWVVFHTKYWVVCDGNCIYWQCTPKQNNYLKAIKGVEISKTVKSMIARKNNVSLWVNCKRCVNILQSFYGYCIA